MSLPQSPQPTTARPAVCLYACCHLHRCCNSCRAAAACPATAYGHSLVAATRLALHRHPLFLLPLPPLLPLVYILSLLHTSTQCVTVRQHMTVHIIPYSIPVRWSWSLSENLIFKQFTGMHIYCIPVRSAYWYASISLFMLFPTASSFPRPPKCYISAQPKPLISEYLYYTMNNHGSKY
jgi:hypothetical protein